MDDLISRQAAIEAIEHHGKAVLGEYNYDEGIAYGYAAAHRHLVDIVKELPSAQPERKTGRWEMKPDPYGFFDEIPVCSECGCTTKWREKYLYCPNCGAKMGGDA